VTETLPATHERLSEAIDTFQPQRLLLIADQPPALDQPPGDHWWYTGQQASDAIDALPAVDLAVLDGDADFGSAVSAIQLVGRLRDVSAMRTLVIASSGSNGMLPRAELIGLGLHRWQDSRDTDRRRRWFHFALQDYKTTPDWLNARHWANPELWDKFRW
jgi:hypothetical protein